MLVIAESSGSLAELGAFATNDTIRKSLRVVLPSHHEVAESFVRYGPVERIKKANRANLGVYPWKIHRNGALNVSSARPHYKEIKTFINDHIQSVPRTVIFDKLDSSRLFYIIYWIIHIRNAVTPSLIHRVVDSISPEFSESDIRNTIYCMQLAKWIKRESYSGDDYFYALSDEDPFDYSYKPDVGETSTVRRKLAFQVALKKEQTIPKYVRKVAAAARIASL